MRLKLTTLGRTLSQQGYACQRCGSQILMQGDYIEI